MINKRGEMMMAIMKEEADRTSKRNFTFSNLIAKA
jgi:hypothetical protein